MVFTFVYYPNVFNFNIDFSKFRSDEALKLYDSAISCDSRNANVYYARAKVYTKYGRSEGAILDLKIALFS
jgi:tetratricopeptide (TPR) repeat protein